MSLFAGLYRIFEVNIIITILLNFKLFTFRDAIKIPIIVYGRYTVHNLMSIKRGSLVLGCPCKTGLIKLNRRIGCNIGSKLRGSLCLNGKLIINGKCDIGQGCNITIREGGVMQVLRELSITGASKIHVYKSVKFGNRVTVSWDVHIHDTDYHYFIVDDTIFSRNQDIEIGDNVWIGHNVTIAKGGIIPSNCIVASNSLINRSFREYGTGLLLAGIPGQIKRCGVKPINNFCQDLIIDQYFKKQEHGIHKGIPASLLY